MFLASDRSGYAARRELRSFCTSRKKWRPRREHARMNTGHEQSGGGAPPAPPRGSAKDETSYTSLIIDYHLYKTLFGALRRRP